MYTLVELCTFDPECRRSSAGKAVRTFLQTELHKLVDNLRTLCVEASREPLVNKRAQERLTMLSSWAAASGRGVASELASRHEVDRFKVLAEEGVAEINGFASGLVEGAEARLDNGDVSELFHLRGVLDWVRTSARVWLMLGFSVMALRRSVRQQSHV